jgi:hypothetical protein
VVTITEQGADYKIGDHLKGGTNVGMTSYRWIEECIRDNQLLDVDEFQIFAAKGSANRSRTVRRQEFTAEDDEILFAAVRKHKERADGVGLSGQRMYEALSAAVYINQGFADNSTLNIPHNLGGTGGLRPFRVVQTSAPTMASVSIVP